MRTLLYSLAVVTLAIGGCKKENKTTAAATGPGSAGSAPGSATAPVEQAGLDVFVDDKKIATITKDKLAEWPRLDSLVPEDARRLGTWMSVSLSSAKPAPTEVARPSASYPDMVPVVFPGADGTASFGMFDRVELAKKGTPAMREDGVTAIRIKVASEGRGGDHQGSTGEPTDPTKLVVAFATADGDKKLTGTQILDLPREPQPDSPDTKGWRLQQFLAAAGVTKFDKVVLVDAGGMSLPLTKKELDDKKKVAFIKLNKQGALRFRLLVQKGKGWETAGDLRALTSVQVK